MGYSTVYNDTQSQEVIHYKSEFSKFHNKYMDMLSKDRSKIIEDEKNIHFKYIDGENAYHKPLYVVVDTELEHLILKVNELKRNYFKMYIDMVYNHMDNDIDECKKLVNSINDMNSRITILRQLKTEGVSKVIDDTRLPNIFINNTSQQSPPVNETTYDDDKPKKNTEKNTEKNKLKKIDKKIKKTVSNQVGVDINLDDVKKELKASSLLFNKEEDCLKRGKNAMSLNELRDAISKNKTLKKYIPKYYMMSKTELCRALFSISK